MRRDCHYLHLLLFWHPLDLHWLGLREPKSQKPYHFQSHFEVLPQTKSTCCEFCLTDDPFDHSLMFDCALSRDVHETGERVTHVKWVQDVLY